MPADPMKMPRKARLWLAAAAIAAVAVMATVLVWNSRPQNEKSRADRPALGLSGPYPHRRAGGI